MKKQLLTLILFVFAAMGILSAQTVDPLCVDGRIYFKIKDNAALNVAVQDGRINPKDVYFLRDITEKYKITDLVMPFISAESDILQRTFRMDFDNQDMVEQLVKELGQHPDIEYAEKAPLFFISLVPNDPYYNAALSGGMWGSANSSWHLNLINASQAWDVTTGDPNIVVAVLDNAIWVDHPDLANKVVAAVDLANGDNDPNPPEATYIWSHGTHSAGLIAAETNNGVGVASIGNGVSIMAVKLGDDASDGQSMAAGFEGIVWAADNGADVINMSWGTPQYFQTMQNIVNYAYNKGCVMVGAAGNNGNGAETQMNPDIPINYVGYPAALPHVIAVGSCDVGDNKSDFSNYGTWIDVLAPGGYASAGFLGIGAFAVLSTTYNTAGTVMDMLNGTTGGAATFGVSGNYDLMQGTSMAAPVTSGLCALMLSANPDLTPEELTYLLKSTCENVDAENADFIDSIGAGRINAYAAVQAAANTVAPLTADFMASAVVIPEGGSVDFTDMSVGTPITWSWNFEGGLPNTSDMQNPSDIVYNTAGVYQVSLTVSDAASNTDTEIKTYYIIVGNSSGGATSAWLEQHTHFSSQYRGVFNIEIADPQTAWILTYDGTGGSISNDFAVTTDGGTTWTPGIIDLPTELKPGDISAIDGNKAWVAAYNANYGGGVFFTDDGGQTWTQQTTAAFTGSTSFTNTIHMFNENDGVVMGDPNSGEFEIYTTSNGGTTWTLLPAASIPNPQTDEMGWTGVKDAYGDTVWFGTSTGRIFRSIDKGLTWQAFTTGEDNVSRISFWDAMNGVIICQVTNQSTGQVESWSMRKTSNGGETWSPITISGGYEFSDVSVVPGQLGMIVATNISQTVPDNFSAYSMDYGTTWEMLDDSVQYTSVEFFDENTGWAGGFNLDADNGGIYKWIGLPSDDIYFSSSPVTEVYEFADYTYNIVVENPGTGTVSISVPAGDELPAWLSLTDNGDGTAVLSGTAPEVSQPSEIFEIAIEATDGAVTIQQDFTINVMTTNEAPVFTSEPSLNHVTHLLYTYNVTTSDPENDPVTITATQLPSWASLTDNGDGTAILTGTPTNTSMIGFSVKLRVSDGMYYTEQIFNIVTTANQDPEFTSTPVTGATVDVLYTYNITATDPELQPLAFEALVKPEWMTFTDNGDGTAVLTGTPDVVNAEGYQVSIQVSDGPNDVTQDFLVIVNPNAIPGFGAGVVNVYPNPAADVIYISNAENASYEVFDMLGHCVMLGTIAGNQFAIQVENLAEGNYMIRLKKDDVTGTLRFEIMK